MSLWSTCLLITIKYSENYNTCSNAYFCKLGKPSSNNVKCTQLIVIPLRNSNNLRKGNRLNLNRFWVKYTILYTFVGSFTFPKIVCYWSYWGKADITIAVEFFIFTFSYMPFKILFSFRVWFSSKPNLYFHFSSGTYFQIDSDLELC